MQDREVELIPKTVLSSDRRLQFACVKLESLVTADQQRRGEYVPGHCTHRPSSHESWGHPKPTSQPFGEAVVEGDASDWD